jgi:hypothetical protein
LKRFLLIALFVLLAVGPVVLLILPSDFFDSGHSVCMSVMLLDRTCPGCGMTRAIQHLIHLDFHKAAEFNKLSFVVLPILVFVWQNELRKLYRKMKTVQV